MSYYYQQSGQPGWGTSQFQFGPPPPPSFQPQSTWGGHDFYRAHATNADPYLFDHAWNRVREGGGAPAGGMGVGLHEARHWHRQAYASSDLNFMDPAEIGHAAAYEAYRSWIHNYRNVYEPLSPDIDRQREALTGLAVAEAARLLSYNQRFDQVARLTASEAAAHTASYIFYQSRDQDHRSRSHLRDPVDDPYVYDDNLLSPRGRSRSRSRHRYSRHRSHSRHSSYGSHAVMPAGGMAGVGYPASASSVAGAFSGYAGSYHSDAPVHMPLSATPYPAGGVALTGSSYGGQGHYGAQSAYGGMSPVGISASAYHAPMSVGVASSYQGSALGVPQGYHRGRSHSMSYPSQYPYAGTAVSAPGAVSVQMPSMSAGVPQQLPSQTIIIHKPRKHKSRHRHRSHSRSPSRYSSYSGSRY